MNGQIGMGDTGVSNTLIGDTYAEETRLETAREVMPTRVNSFNDLVKNLARQLAHATSFEEAWQRCDEHGLALWRAATAALQSSEQKDDRPLYWGRLQMLRQVRQQPFAIALRADQRHALLAAVESSSRGRTSAQFASANFTQAHFTQAHFTQAESKRILVSGFDPFGFDAGADGTIDLTVTNPSGAAAMELSNTTIFHAGMRAEVQAVIFPVRYEDFDLGVVEDFFRPYFEEERVDMILTISRGRTDFDLERFTGRRRSALRGDNANRAITLSGPLSALPRYRNAPLDSPEFLESTLPISHLQTLQSHYRINDNRRVAYVNAQQEAVTVEANTLAELAERIAHSGSGGGFLSNEISYRTHWLREQLGSSLPVGHLHVPKPDVAPDGTPSHDPHHTQALIVAQVKEVVKAAMLGL